MIDYSYSNYSYATEAGVTFMVNNMLYLPVSIQGWVMIKTGEIEHIFLLMYSPLIEGILVLTGQRPTSNFDPIGEGLIIFMGPIVSFRR